MKYEMRTNEFFVKPDDCEYKRCEVVRFSDNKVFNQAIVIFTNATTGYNLIDYNNFTIKFNTSKGYN